MDSNTKKHLAMLLDSRGACEKFIGLASGYRARTDSDDAAAELLADRIRSDHTSGLHEVLKLTGQSDANIAAMQDTVSEGVDWLLIGELFVLASIGREVRERLDPDAPGGD